MQVAAPEPTYSAPDLGREAGTGDAVEDTGDRPPRQPMFTAIEWDEVTYVCPCTAQALSNLQQKTFLW